jgi:outer membrane protein, multidrug efflux system
VGVSIAKLYPDLNLTLGLGWSSNKSDDIFVDQAFLYSTLLNISQPIFMGGQLRAQVKGAEAKYEQLAAEYAKTVLTAMKEVEDELANEQFQAIQIEYVRVRFKEAKAAEALAKQRYQRGVEALLSVLETERRKITAEEELAVLKGRIWTTRVNLFLALGGDWVVRK